MILRIAVDMDGTLLDSHGQWEREYDNARHKHYELAKQDETWNYFPDLCASCWRDCLDDPEITRRIPLMEGAFHAIDSLAQNNTLYLVSHRDPDFTDLGRECLQRLGVLQFFKETNWSWNPKMLTCTIYECDLLIDDNPVEIEACTGYTRPLCFAAPYNRNVFAPRARGGGEVLAYIYGFYGHLAGARVIVPPEPLVPSEDYIMPRISSFLKGSDVVYYEQRFDYDRIDKAIREIGA
jgi:5'(3')-deoxyribonucleotidase